MNRILPTADEDTPFGIIEEPDDGHWLVQAQDDLELPAQVLRWGH